MTTPCTSATARRLAEVMIGDLALESARNDTPPPIRVSAALITLAAQIRLLPFDRREEALRGIEQDLRVLVDWPFVEGRAR